MCKSDMHLLEGTFLSDSKNFKRVLLSIADGVYMTDPNRKIVFWNRACEKITGFSSKDILGHKCSDNILNHVDMNGNMLCETEHCPLQQCMVKETPGEKPSLVRAKRRDGSRVIVEVSVAPIKRDNGEVIGGIEVFRDVTLVHEMRETKASFLSAVTHDLKAPLTVIKGFLEIVLSGDAGSMNETQKDFLSSALEECDRLNKMLGDLSDLARFEATEFSFAQRPVNVVPLLQQAQHNFTFEAEQKGLDFKIELPQALYVAGDRDRLYQVITNLVSNAIKYTGKGFVYLYAGVSGDKAIISVSDSGIGMSREEHEKIFEQFYRIDNLATRKVVGTGIGLSIVKKIVDMHKGEICVRSEPGQGSTFRISLPLLAEEMIPSDSKRAAG
ncbi:MAG: PAS domain-containing sensor histidine kinase [Desulfotomaculaceae bacterium]|nr:PAS domain-containing sensor histidine kinase [Desulfotomaculaceae bacterium]MDD4767172.1 PAS domain-containing sensor histidine kinase [Desulfotomaculaceae bacterium]